MNVPTFGWQLTKEAEEYLQDLADELEVPDSRYEQAEARYKSLGDWLHRPKSTVRDYGPQVYVQGSFRLGMAIKPANDQEEYDVDAVCEFRQLNTGSGTQEQLKTALGVEVEAYRQAYGMLKPMRERRRCWTLDYADGAQFHMDVMPAVPNDQAFRQLLERNQLDTRFAATGIAITDNESYNYRYLSADWHRSNPKGCQVRTRSVQLGGQESAATTASVMKDLAGCHLIVDATAEAKVFNLVAAIARRERVPVVWAEVFGGGGGGLVARSRPGIDPPPQIARRQLNAWCESHGITAPAATAGSYVSSDETPMVADDGDVSVIAAHATGPEILMQEALGTTGHVFERHAKDLPGRPDFVCRAARVSASSGGPSSSGGASIPSGPLPWKPGSIPRGCGASSPPAARSRPIIAA